MAVRGFEGDVQDNWQNGVITAILQDRLPDGAVPSAKNGQFYNIGPQRAIYGTRLGCTLQNTTPNATAIVSQYFFHGSSDLHLLVAATSGDLKKIVTGTISNISSSAFTSTSGEFSWETFNDLAFVVNGVDAKKTNGTTVSKFGIGQPAPGDWTATAVAGGTAIPTGETYSVAISYFNSSTGHEGPRSATKDVTLAGGQRIQVVTPTNGSIADSQVDFVKIYLQRQSTQNKLYLVTAGTDVAITGVSGWAPNTTVKIDSSASQIAAFTILAPEINDNYPPPSGTKFIRNLRSRMFAAVGADIYWSKLGEPESFNLLDSTETIGENDGEDITGLWVLNDTLVITKRSGIYYLDGDDPQTWIVRIKDKSIGAVNFNGTCSFEDKLYFMSLRGPQRWSTLDSAIEDITTEFIGPNFAEDHINPDDLTATICVLHPTQNYVAWAVRPVSETRNTVIVPFHTKLNRWMSDEWRMTDVRSCAVVEDSVGREWPFIADYDGFIYKVGVGGSDGLPSGVTASGSVTSSTGTTLTDSTATWTVNQLVGKYITTWNTINGLRSAQRRRITANTATQITVVSAWDNNPNTGDIYNLAGVLLDFRSGFRNGGQEFFRKRLEYVFVEMTVSAEGEEVTVETYVNGDTENPVMHREFSLGESDFWDDSNWDEMEWAGTATTIKRIPIHHIGNSWETRILHIATSEQIYLSRLGVQWLTKTKKVGTIGG